MFDENAAAIFRDTPGRESSCSDVEESSRASSSHKSDYSSRGKRIKRKSKQSVLRMLANQERSEMVPFLQMELLKVNMFYMSQWQRLSVKLEQ